MVEAHQVHRWRHGFKLFMASWLFNASHRLCYSDIKSWLNLPEEDVVRLLKSLSCAKYKILTKEPSSINIAETYYFQFNSMFTHKLSKIKILLPPGNERKTVVEEVDKNTRPAMDASIVRIMKSRKVLLGEQLVAESTEQLGILTFTFLT